jgi:hypothetical protein
VATIGSSTTARELAALVSQALENAGITATLTGGAAVSIYSDNEYRSFDLDFVTNARVSALGAALEPLGFVHQRGVRQFVHPHTDFYVEFPPGPIGFGETHVSDDSATTIQTPMGLLRIITPTQSVMDRLAAYAHWHDRQSLDQATMVARRQQIDWPELLAWVEREGIDLSVVRRLKEKAERG